MPDIATYNPAPIKIGDMWPRSTSVPGLVFTRTDQATGADAPWPSGSTFIAQLRQKTSPGIFAQRVLYTWKGSVAGNVITLPTVSGDTTQGFPIDGKVTFELQVLEPGAAGPITICTGETVALKDLAQ